MKYKKIMILAIFLVLLFAISAVSAVENATDDIVGTDVASEDVASIDNNEEDVVSVDNQNISEVGATEDNKLSASTGTFTDLANLIENSNGELNLTRNYIYTNYVSTDTDSKYRNGITINKCLIINGNGFKIDGNGAAKVFKIMSDNVILNNIIFLNCKESGTYSYGGAISWYGLNGTLQNCIFDNDIASKTTNGGEVYWKGDYGKVYNCIFIKSRASKGSAIYWDGTNGEVYNCNFTNCYSNSGTVYWNGGNGRLYDCNFRDSVATGQQNAYAGAIYWNAANGLVFNSNFINCSASAQNAQGGAIYWSGVKGSLTNCVFERCSISGTSSTGCAIYWVSSKSNVQGCEFKSCSSLDGIVQPIATTIYFKCDFSSFSDCNFLNTEKGILGYGFNNTIKYCTFKNCKKNIIRYHGANSTLYACTFEKITNGESIIWYGANGTVFNCNFTQCSGSDAGAIRWNGANGTLHSCNFIECKALSNSANGGAVYWDGINGSLYKCNFDTCFATNGCTSIYVDAASSGAIYWSGDDGKLYDSHFSNCFSTQQDSNKGDKILGGAISWIGSNGNLYGCDFYKCYISSKFDGTLCYGGAIYWKGITGILHNCSFNKCYISEPHTEASGGSIYWDGINGSLYNCNFIDSNTNGYHSYGGAIYWNADNGTVHENSFQNCLANIVYSSHTEGDGNAIYWKGINGTLYGCWYNGDLYNYLGNMIAKADNCKLHNKLQIGVTDINPWENENITINITGNGFVKTYIYKVNSYGGISIYKTFKTIINTSQIKIALDKLQFGMYNVTVTYSGDDIFESETKSTLFEALKYDSNISIRNNDNLIAGDTLNVNITLNDDASGLVYLTIDKKSYSGYVTNGNVVISVPKIIGGKYNYTINYNGDSKYKSILLNKTINVTFKAPIINLTQINPIVYGDNIVINPNVSSDASGVIEIYVDNAYKGQINIGNTFTLTNTNYLNVGEHIIVIKYKGDDFYLASESSSKFNITKANVFIYPDIFVDTEYMRTQVTVYLNKTATGNITWIMCNESYINEIDSYIYGYGGKYAYSMFTFPNLTAGQYTYVISYDGDQNFNPKCDSYQFIVPFKESKTNLFVNNINVGDTLSVGLNITGNPLTNISLYLNGIFLMNVTTEKDIKLTNLQAGTYTLSAIYNRDDYYDYSNDTKTFKVSKLNPVINVKVNDAVYGQTAKIIIDTNAKGNVSISIESIITYNNILINNNQIIQDINDVDSGTYPVKVVYHGNDNYNAKTYYTKLTINKASTNVVGTVEDIDYTQNVIINVKGSADGIAVVKIDENLIKNINVVANTVASATFENIPAGKHNVTITLKPTNTNFDESTYNTDFTVSKKDASVSLNVVDSIYGDDVIVNVTAGEDGKVVLKVGDITHEKNILANTPTKFNLGVLAVNAYNVEVSFDAGENYNLASKQSTFTVTPAKSEITSIQAQDNIYSENTVINVKTNVSGVLTVKINNNEKTFNIDANKLTSLDLDKYDAGIYNIDLSLDAGVNYTKATSNTKVTIAPKQTTTNVNADNSVYGNNVIVKVTASENGKVTVQIGNIVKSVNVNANKVASVDFGILDVNSYEVSATFDGGKNFNTSSDKTALVISPKASSVTIVDSDNSYIYSENVVINVKADADGTLTVKLGDKTQSKQVTAGNVVSFDFGVLDVNQYDVKISLDTGNNYIASQNTASITINPKSTVVTINTKEYGADEKVIVNVTASEKGIVTIKLESIVKTVNVNANVLTSVDLGILDTGSYVVVANFTAGNNYVDSSNSNTIKVLSKIKDEDVNITIPEIKANQENNIVISLPADATGTVTLTIGNNSYTFTVKNGVADIKVPKLDDGNYDYKINYSGNNKYSSFENTGSINVSKTTPEIVIPPLDAHSDDESVTISLPSDATGTVTLTINGKDYPFAIVNGKANVLIPNLGDGNYPYTITYSGDSKYSSFTNTGSLKVNKTTVNPVENT
uniref:right-handed parallel beta-helix repeat-containing protein n=1 Tax=Methanobrevibacter sp. TaxID=66852 RepID=UPI003865E4B5